MDCTSCTNSEDTQPYVSSMDATSSKESSLNIRSKKLLTNSRSSICIVGRDSSEKNLTKANISVENNLREEKLNEIGYHSSGPPTGWHELELPKKTNFLVLLERMIKSYEQTNVQIRIQDHSFDCHMEVLQCYSEYFRQLTDRTVVNLPHEKVTQQALIMIYDWMLSDDPFVEREGFVELLNAAQFLKIDELVAQCWCCLDDDRELREDSAFMMYLEARKYDNELIMQLMLERISKFFLMLVASEEFVTLKHNEVCALLQLNSISVNSETEILMAAVRWLNFDFTVRNRFLLEIMSCVRFCLMTPWQLVCLLNGSIDAEELDRAICSPEVRKMISNAISYTITKYHYNPNSENLYNLMESLNMNEPQERLWISDPIWTEYFECLNETMTKYTSFLEYLDMIRKSGRNHWKTLMSFEGNPNLAKIALQNRISLQNKTQNGILKNESIVNIIEKDDKVSPKMMCKLPIQEILIFGGVDPISKCCNSNIGYDTFKYNPVEKTCERITRLPQPRHHHGAVKYGNKIYILGGTQPETKISKPIVSDKMWSLELSTLKWYKEPNLPQPRCDFGLARTSAGFYVIGGDDKRFSIQSSLYFFNTKSRIWRELAPMKIPRSGLAACILGSKIWVAGGLISGEVILTTDSMESYELNENKWTLMTSYLRVPCCYAKMCTIQNSLYIIGGAYLSNEGKMKSLNNICKYNTNKNQWTKVASLNEERNGHDIVSYEDGIFILGGLSLDKNLTLNSIEYFCAVNESCEHLSSLPLPISGLAGVPY